MRTHCPRGHEMTDDNVYMSRGDGIRRCRTCRRVNDENYRIRKNINGDWNRHNTRAKPASSLVRESVQTVRPSAELIEDAQRRLLAPRSITAELMGDPPAGASALDRRQGC